MDGAGSTRRRLFAAVALPETVRRHLADAVEQVRTAAVEPTGTGRAGAVRWTDPASWHLTLAFYGAVAGAENALLMAALDGLAARHRPLQLALGGAGRFGQRVLWAGVTGNRSAVLALAASTAEAGRIAGIGPAEDRPYHPHLTVARGGPGADLSGAAAALDGYAGPAWRVEELVLVESQLGQGPGGTAMHVAVRAFSLG